MIKIEPQLYQSIYPEIDVRLYANLAAAVAAIGSNAATLLIPDAQTMAADLTIPATTTIRLLHGGTVAVGTGLTLTLNCQIEAGAYQIFICAGTGKVVFGAGSTRGLRPEWWGAKGDDSTDCTAAFVLANAAASAGVVSLGPKQNILLSAGVYQVTATTGNYAVTINCPIKGEGTAVSIIKNVGTGSALRTSGVMGEIYYSRFSDFAVVGNASSEDGICLNTDGDINECVGYSSFNSVDSYSHGRHGLVHRASWGTKYIDCKFHHNGGLGVYLKNTGTDEGFHNAISFTDCESRWNGGLGDKTTDYYSGGIRAEGPLNLFRWKGGIVESNNAWAFIFADGDGAISPVISELVDVDGAFFENTPPATSSSTLGGNFRVSGGYENVIVRNCWGTYGAKSGAVGYAFYVINAATNDSYFKEHDNYLTAAGAGTNIRDYGIKPDWTRPVISKTLTAGATTILTVVPEIVSNGGFAANTTDWSAQDCTIASVAGGQYGNCMQLTWVTGVLPLASHAISGLTIGTPYKITGYVKSGTSGNDTFTIAAFDSSWVSMGVVTGTSSGSWTKYTKSFIATDTEGYVVSYKTSATPGTMLFDSISLGGHIWSVSGFINCKEGSDETGGIYPFVAANDEISGGLKVAVGASIVGSAATPPTMAWVGGALQVTFAASHVGHIELSIGGTELDPSDIFTLSADVFCNDFIKRRQD